MLLVSVKQYSDPNQTTAVSTLSEIVVEDTKPIFIGSPATTDQSKEKLDTAHQNISKDNNVQTNESKSEIKTDHVMTVPTPNPEVVISKAPYESEPTVTQAPIVQLDPSEPIQVIKSETKDTCGIGYEIGILDSETSTKPILECFKI